jgi:hypothetical protein
MEIFTFILMIAAGAYIVKSRDQKGRIVFLAKHLGRYPIERLMQTLIEGYARALGEPDSGRQAQIFKLLATTELELCEQFNRFAEEFARADAVSARVSTLTFGLPYASRLFPAATFDLRRAMTIHAQAIVDATAIPVSTPSDLPSAATALKLSKSRAFTISAELLLVQHTCHWFCRSKMIASARLLARHNTSYAQVLAVVSPDTRSAYLALTAP